MKTYRIHRVDLPEDVPAESPIWQQAETAEIDSFSWDASAGYRPHTTARLLAGKHGISVLFVTDETPLKAVYTQNNQDVWCDSCIEFFIQPNPADPRYLNFEMNSIGTLLLGIGTQTDDRTLLDFDVKRFRIVPKVQNGTWTHRLYIPFDFLQEQFGKVDPVFRGNLFKCGDDTPHPHFGSWNPIIWPEPQFHLSQCFGTFILESAGSPEEVSGRTNQYRIVRVDKTGAIPMESPLWQKAETAAVNCFAWDNGKGYRPNTWAKLLAGRDGISVLFATDESPLRSVCAEHNGSICCDSCVEFFLRPAHDARYLNFEMNCTGRMMIGFGAGRPNRQLLAFDAARFCLCDRISDGIWQHAFFIPFDFLREIYGDWSEEFFGNLYKCGDDTIHPHYGSWNPVGTVDPDFHAPEFFGSFVPAIEYSAAQ